MHLTRANAQLGLWIVVLGLSFTAGCKDKAKCDEALNTARQSMQEGYLDMELARKWRDHAGKICGQGPELEALDNQILEREAALVKAAEDQAKNWAEAGQKAIKKAEKLWKAWDKLDAKEQTKDSLSKTNSKAKKLVNGLTPEYAKQVTTYNKSQYDKRKKKVEG